MNYILKSVKWVIDQSPDVKIDKASIKKFCSQIKPKDIINLENNLLVDFPKLKNNKEVLAFLFVQDAINFCFWGKPKWAINYHDKTIDGFYALLASLNRAIKQGFPIFNPKYLAEIPRKDLQIILKGNVIIPLFNERLKALRELGLVTCKKFSGDFKKIIQEGQNNVLKLLKIITSSFPSFNDFSIYSEKRVYFYKRAQLLINEIHDIFGGKGLGKFKNIDELTAFADYKIPYVLEKIGILQYSPRLIKKINDKIEISPGNPQEVEIRAGMVWAIELIKRELQKKVPYITSGNIDNYLWLLGQKKSFSNKLYHRTRTIYY